MKMKLGFICCSLFMLNVEGLSNGKIVPGLFNQILDHFSQTDSPTLWQQRYWSNNEFFKSKDAPIFLRVNGESVADPSWLRGGAWNEWANQYGAMMYHLEHRYFGESRPTSDASVDNLEYLTSQQALADIANFIDTMNEQQGYTSKNKWILFGGSYPGDLVAWARLHYPDQVFGSVSSSGPLLAKADFFESYDVVQNSLNMVAGCSDVVHQAIIKMQQIIETGSKSDVKNLFNKLNFCDLDLSVWQNKVMVFRAPAAALAETVEYNDINHKPALNIKEVCSNYMMNTGLGEPLDRLIGFYNNKTKPHSKCQNVSYQRYIESLAEEKWYADRWSMDNMQQRLWRYLLCNELGFGQTSEKKDALFSDTIPFKFYVDQCSTVFGSQFDEKFLLSTVDETNKRNGGMDINVTNVIFVQGSVDAWHVLGMIKHPTESSPLIYINGTSHCTDMLPSKDTDIPALKEARTKINSYLGKMLSQT